MSDSLYLASIKLVGFKNHEHLTCNFSPAFNGISGLNGMGKTNLLDAIYYLLTGKSYFNYNDRLSIRQGEEAAFISGVFVEDLNQTSVSVSIPLNGPKQMKNDGALCRKLSEYIGKFSAVMITPDDISIVTGSGENRRSFMDKIICQHNREYLLALNQYIKLIEQRNRALKQMDESGMFNADLINIYNEQLVSPTTLIHQGRKSFMDWLAPVAADIYKRLTEEREEIEITYVSPLDKQDLLSLMKLNESKDRVLCRTSSGVHKDDLEMTLSGGMDIRKFGSQGQIKSWIMSMKLAGMLWLKENKNQIPILLLDDVFEKIDETRLRNLLHWLEMNHQGQWFVTDAHKMRLQECVQNLSVEKKFFNIDETFHESGETHQTSVE